jgi:hypothetical protein
MNAWQSGFVNLTGGAKLRTSVGPMLGERSIPIATSKSHDRKPSVGPFGCASVLSPEALDAVLKSGE